MLRFALLFVLTAGSLFATPAALKPETMTWTIGGVVRKALVFAPSKGTRGKAPIVFAFHGSGDNIEHFSLVGFQDAWPEAVVVYMQGLERNPGQSNTSFDNTDATGNNPDLQFFDTVLADMHQKFRIDDARVFASGFSNGARFTYLLWATRSKIFAAFAPVAGSLTTAVPPKDPKPLIAIGGSQDANVAFKQQLESIELAKTLNGATGLGESCGTDCTLYRSSRNAPVITIIHSGGHFYPSFATDHIVSFFRLRQ